MSAHASSVNSLPQDLFAAVLRAYQGAPGEQEPWQGASLNQFHAPTTLHRIDRALEARVLAALRPVQEAWVGNGVKLEPTALYGIRSYVRSPPSRPAGGHRALRHVGRLHSF